MPQHIGDHLPEPVYQPEHYASDLHGHGRWVMLEAPPGTPAVRLFTDDHDRLGVMQVGTSQTAAHLVATLTTALRGAHKAGATTSDVFDYWAASSGPYVAAGEVVVGDLELLTPKAE